MKRTPDLGLIGCEPQLIRHPRIPNQVKIRCRLLEKGPTGNRQSDKFLRLELTAQDAMILLALLCNLQEELGLPVPKVTKISVPPKDRHH
jgi:hypothetical protein